MKNLNKKLKGSKVVSFLYKLVIYLASVVAITLYGKLNNTGEFFYDAGRYWYLSTFFKDINENFSLLFYTEELRGYFFPLVLFALRELLGNYLETYSSLIPLFNATIITTISLILLPEIVKDLFGVKLNWLRRLLLLGIFFFIWRGYVIYPLSDIPAVSLMLVCASLLIKILKATKITPKLFLMAFVLGLALSAVYFIRPVYLINVPIVVGSFGIFLLRIILKDKKQIIRGVLLSICLLVGVILPTIPQYHINSNNFNRKTFMVSSGLYSDQLIWGLRMQKYETNVNTDVYIHRSAIFEDPQYHLIYANNFDLYTEKLNQNNVKYVLMHMVRHYPLDVATIYFRHFFNGLDVRYPTVYVFNVFKISLPIMLFNYTLIFLFLFLKKPANFLKINFSKIVAIALFTFPVLLALPGAVEPRFFLPVHLLIYAVVVAIFPWRKITKEEMINHLKSVQTYKWLVAYGIFLITCLTLSALVGTTLKESGILLHN